MKVMVMTKGSGADEGKITPTQEMFGAMGAYNEKLVKAGIMLDGGGLKPSSEGAKQCPTDPSSGLRQVLEVRPYFEAEDFGAEYTPEIQEQEERLAAEIRARNLES